MAVEVTAAVTNVWRIGGGHHSVNPGDFLRLAGVDADYFGMGVLAAENRPMQLVFEHQVDAVDALADDALDAAHAGGARTDDFQFRFGHGLSPPCDSIGGEMDRIDDLVVTGAAADVAGDRFFNIFRCGFGSAVEQGFHRYDISRRAVPALHRARIDKGLLHGNKRVAVGQPFDGYDFRAVGIGSHGDAGIDRLAIIDDRAGAALTGVAAELRAFVFQCVAEKFQQRRGRLRAATDRLAVDRSIDGETHYATSLPVAACQLCCRPRRVNASTIQRRFSALLR